MFFMGGYLLFGSIPEKSALNQYRKSRKLIGVNFLILGVQFFLQWYFRTRVEHLHIASALNITFFFFSGALIAYAYISLLDNTFLNRRRIVRDTAICSAVAIVVWGSILLLPHAVSSWVQRVAAVLLLIYIACLASDFIRVYKNSVRKINNYYADNVALFIKCLSKSIFLKIAIGIISPVVAFLTDWSVFIYLIINIGLFYYIFCCYMNYLPNSEVVDSAVNERDDEPRADADDGSVHGGVGNYTEAIAQSLAQWVETKGYLKQGLTINVLSSELKVNKRYVSLYINSEYKMTFREWINTLRIEYAKKIMTEDPSRVNDEIADMTGYASRPHFIRVFTDIVGESPSTWKSRNSVR